MTAGGGSTQGGGSPATGVVAVLGAVAVAVGFAATAHWLLTADGPDHAPRISVVTTGDHRQSAVVHGDGRVTTSDVAFGRWAWEAAQELPPPETHDRSRAWAAPDPDGGRMAVVERTQDDRRSPVRVFLEASKHPGGAS